MLLAPLLLLAFAAIGWFGLDRVESSHAETPVKAGANTVIIGVASVIDADTLDIHGTRIRLVGVDAPESGQKCRDGYGDFNRCGAIAANSLDHWISSNPVSCQIEGKDRYGRSLGQCSVRGQSVQDWLVINGHALAYRSYSKEYVPSEDKARLAKAGVWAGEFIEPWEWRKGVRLEGEKAGKAVTKVASN